MNASTHPIIIPDRFAVMVTVGAYDVDRPDIGARSTRSVIYDSRTCPITGAFTRDHAINKAKDELRKLPHLNGLKLDYRVIN